jgi:hypothetical protein
MGVVQSLPRVLAGGQASRLLRWGFFNNTQGPAQNVWRSHKAEVTAPNGFEGLGPEHDWKQRFQKGVGGVDGHGCAVCAWEVFPGPIMQHGGP